MKRAAIDVTILILLSIGWCFLLNLAEGKGARRAKEESATQLHSLQSSLDHLRSLNWLLSRQLEREEQGEQLKP